MVRTFETTITRRTKEEAERAIIDLEKRGYSISFPLTEIKRANEGRGKYDYQKGRYSYNALGIYSCWTAKMKKEA